MQGGLDGFYRRVSPFAGRTRIRPLWIIYPQSDTLLPDKISFFIRITIISSTVRYITKHITPAMLDSNPSWVAVMTRPNIETQVAERFAQSTTPIEYYLPMMACKDKRIRRKEQFEKPMFPSYIFARICDKQIYQTRTTKGVLFIVSSGHSIIRVPDKDIEAVRRFEASQRKIHLYETNQLVKGARATILDGEFAGMEGTLVKHCKDGNFCVNIDVMNVSIVVRLKRDELKPIAENPVADTQ